MEMQGNENLGFSDLAMMQYLVHADGGWQNCWEKGVTPWDLGNTTPIIYHLVHTDAIPKGRALVPGCGRGYDVVALAAPDRHVTGLDLSDGALDETTKLAASSPNYKNITVLNADFFTWQPPEQFDFIFDYTFFCAIDPKLRPAWASRMAELLKPGGELLTLIFPITDHVGGPPYKVSVAEYEELLCPLGFKPSFIGDNELAIESRKGIEKIGRWKKIAN